MGQELRMVLLKAADRWEPGWTGCCGGCAGGTCLVGLGARERAGPENGRGQEQAAQSQGEKCGSLLGGRE